MNYDYILFDLDGTLTDPGLGITNSAMYALDKFDIKVADRSLLYHFIGPPLRESFIKHYSFTADQAEKAYDYFGEYYRDKGIYENSVYDGIPRLLQHLKDNGKSLVVATSKPTVYAIQVLDFFDLSNYFVFVAGCELDGTRVKKDEVIAYALKHCKIDSRRAVMIGDREHDIIGAKKNGVASIGVLYGYGSREELAGADHIAADMDALRALLD